MLKPQTALRAAAAGTRAGIRSYFAGGWLGAVEDAFSGGSYKLVPDGNSTVAVILGGRKLAEVSYNGTLSYRMLTNHTAAESLLEYAKRLRNRRK